MYYRGNECIREGDRDVMSEKKLMYPIGDFKKKIQIVKILEIMIK